MKILNRWTSACIWESDHATMRETVEAAVVARANLAGANLAGADLYEAAGAALVIARTRILPAGSIEGWKFCRNGVLVRLLIPAECPRSSAFGRKCRAAYADVIEVIGADVGVSKHDETVEYRAGSRVTAHQWDEVWANECSGGIHFFITREEAEAYS